jgi:hypothetical protein
VVGLTGFEPATSRPELCATAAWTCDCASQDTLGSASIDVPRSRCCTSLLYLFRHPGLAGFTLIPTTAASESPAQRPMPARFPSPQTDVQVDPDVSIYACEVTIRTLTGADNRRQLRPKLRPRSRSAWAWEDVLTNSRTPSGIRPGGPHGIRQRPSWPN